MFKRTDIAYCDICKEKTGELYSNGGLDTQGTTGLMVYTIAVYSEDSGTLFNSRVELCQTCKEKFIKLCLDMLRFMKPEGRLDV